MDYNLSDIANNEMYDFSMYTIANRAIPNMIDGQKPVQRFYLYSSIKNTPTAFKKVSAVSGIISDYGYQHGENSAAGAGVLMASTWSNNICLVEGRGSFGTRQIQQAGAPRYIYTRLHENFSKYIKDINLAPVHDDPEHEPPKFYIPVIPLVLANGVSGIATGFACKIFPRSELSLHNACLEYLSTGTIKNKLDISFPLFTGETIWNEEIDRYQCFGTYKRVSSTKLEISEIPYGFDREDYIKILDKLEEEDYIKSYEDNCSKNKFAFTVNMSRSILAAATHDTILKKFRLVKKLKENITVIDYDGKLREYDDERALISDFIEYRLSFLSGRITHNIDKFTEEVRKVNVKIQFIEAILNDIITFKGFSTDEIKTQILCNTDAISEDTTWLLRLPIHTMTSDMVQDLHDKANVASTELKYWQSTTENEQFGRDLAELSH